jgi:hypothetical protein
MLLRRSSRSSTRANSSRIIQKQLRLRESKLQEEESSQDLQARFEKLIDISTGQQRGDPEWEDCFAIAFRLYTTHVLIKATIEHPEWKHLYKSHRVAYTDIPPINNLTTTRENPFRLSGCLSPPWPGSLCEMWPDSMGVCILGEESVRVKLASVFSLEFPGVWSRSEVPDELAFVQVSGGSGGNWIQFPDENLLPPSVSDLLPVALSDKVVRNTLDLCVHLGIGVSTRK